MKKYFFIIFIIFVVVLIVCNNIGEYVSDESKAIEIGKTALKEYLSDEDFKEIEKNIIAEENSEFWYIRNKPIDVVHKGNNNYMTAGGGVYVKVRKCDGKVLEMGFLD